MKYLGTRYAEDDYSYENGVVFDSLEEAQARAVPGKKIYEITGRAWLVERKVSTETKEVRI